MAGMLGLPAGECVSGEGRARWGPGKLAGSGRNLGWKPLRAHRSADVSETEWKAREEIPWSCCWSAVWREQPQGQQCLLVRLQPALAFVTAEFFCNGGPGVGDADDAANIVFLGCWSRDREAVGSGTPVRVKMRPRALPGIALDQANRSSRESLLT